MNIECRLCNTDTSHLYYSQGDNQQYKYYKCPNCGLVNLDLAQMDIYQNQEKYEFNDSFPDPRNSALNKGAGGTYEFIQRNIPSRGNYLDIGCGNGALLYLAQQDGWHVKGIEISKNLASQVAKELGIEVTAINFMDVEDFSEQYDLVTLRHVLEHIPDSLRAMDKINRLLKPGGYAILEFPNIEGISFRMRRFMERTGIHRKKYSAKYRPGHCNEFDNHSFAFLANRSGFELLVWETYSSSKIGNVFSRP